MNKLDELLSKAPVADSSWHCPWFWLIVGFGLNGVTFGGLAYILYSIDFGLAAVGLGLIPMSFAIGSRSREDSQC